MLWYLIYNSTSCPLWCSVYTISSSTPSNVWVLINLLPFLIRWRHRSFDLCCVKRLESILPPLQLLWQRALLTQDSFIDGASASLWIYQIAHAVLWNRVQEGTAYYVVPWQFFFFSHHAEGKETSCIVIILNVHWSWFTNAQFILYSTESLRKGERELTELPRIFNGFLMFNKVKCSFHYLLYSGFSSFDWKGFLDGIVISNNLLTIALLLVLKRTNSNDTCFFFSDAVSHT